MRRRLGVSPWLPNPISPPPAWECPLQPHMGLGRGRAALAGHGDSWTRRLQGEGKRRRPSLRCAGVRRDQGGQMAAATGGAGRGQGRADAGRIRDDRRPAVATGSAGHGRRRAARWLYRVWEEEKKEVSRRPKVILLSCEHIISYNSAAYLGHKRIKSACSGP
nr:uncharacterized protein LOC127326537 [Lolium perenne]